jgi:hypothetical protein
MLEKTYICILTTLLLLTDKEHIVRAEGFKLEELDDRIKEAGSAGR